MYKNTDEGKKKNQLFLNPCINLNYTYSSLTSNCRSSFIVGMPAFIFIGYYYFKQQSKGDKTQEIAFIRTQQNWQGDPESDAASKITVKLIFLKMTRFSIVSIPSKQCFWPMLINTCYKGTKKEIHWKLMLWQG